MKNRTPLTYRADLCKGCLICHLRCPQGAIAVTEERNAFGDRIIAIKPDDCTSCGICIMVCPDRAIRWAGRPQEEVADVG